MKISNAARLIFWMAAISIAAVLVRAQSGETRADAPESKRAPLNIVDQNGRPARNGVRSPTGQVVDVQVGLGGFTFSPDTVNISTGDTVRWTWASGGHSVTSGVQCTADGQFCSPNNMNCSPGVLSNLGFVYEFTFTQPGSFSYFCIAHCAFGMTGSVNVSGASPTPTPTATATTTATATATATGTVTATPSATGTVTATPTPKGTRPRPTPRPRPIPVPRP